MQKDQKNDLTALVGSRICHDLISPLGAIGNGLELLQMTGAQNSAELSLISDSIESANARVRFFRIAYGNAETGQVVKGAELLQILSAMYEQGRMDIVWTPADTPRIDAKLTLLTLQCLETALPYGGRIDVTAHENSWVIVATAERLILEQDLWSRLTQDSDISALRPAQVQFGLLAETVHRMRRRLNVRLSDNEIRVAF